MENNQVLLELEGVDKSFGGVHALDHVSFKVNIGQVHAIVGENGAGKSTLMKILAGSYQQDKGVILFNGKEVKFNSPRDANAMGINIIYQEFFKFPALNVIANVFAGREIIRHGFLDEKEMRKRAEEVFNRMRVKINLDEPVKNISIAQQQLIEIAKALVNTGSLVIMDEPNSSLTDKETRALFETIRLLKTQGMTILYISHRLEDVFEICDCVTVMRDGKYVGTWEKNETNIPFIISQMIGRPLENVFPPIIDAPLDSVSIIEVKNLFQKGHLDEINFNVHKGEVIGFAGLEGCGIRDLFNILFGLDHADSGDILYLGKSYQPGFSSDAINKGWGMIPANRRDQGLFLKWSIKDNMSIVILKKFLNQLGLLNEKDVSRLTDTYVQQLNISTDSIEKKVFDLSGGNQQKVVIAKWLATKPNILIMDDPTRGIDVGAKAEIYQLIRNLAKDGIAILLCSSEIDEILYLSNRVHIMRNGKIIKEFMHGQVDKAEIMRYVSGDLSLVSL